MSWEGLASDIDEMFAECSGADFETQVEALHGREVYTRFVDYASRDLAAEAAARRARYATDPEFAARCRERARAWAQLNSERLRLRVIRRYDRLTKAGACCSCGEPMATMDRRRCPPCAEANAMTTAARRARERVAKAAAGKGTRCGICGTRGHNRRGCTAVTA